MPIGFDPGDLGGGRGGPPSSRPAPVTREPPGLDDVLDEIGRGLWNWVAVVTRSVAPVVWTRWTTAADARLAVGKSSSTPKASVLPKPAPSARTAE